MPWVQFNYTSSSNVKWKKDYVINFILVVVNMNGVSLWKLQKH